MLVGLLIGGFLSDRYGRKVVYCSGCIGVLFVTWVTVFPKDFAVFIAGRTLSGLANGKSIGTSQICFNGHEPRQEIEVGYMKDNTKCITISLTTSIGNHCFLGIEANLGSVYQLILSQHIVIAKCCTLPLGNVQRFYSSFSFCVHQFMFILHVKI